MTVDLTITISTVEPPSGEGHNVVLEHDGERANGFFSLAAIAAEIAKLKTELRKREPDAAVLRAAGSALFGALFDGDLFQSYIRAVTRAEDRGEILRIRINTVLPALMGLPWEYLYDSASGHWLALRSEIALVRTMPLTQHTPAAIEGPLRVLLMISDPTDLPKLDVGRELANLEAVEATAAIELIQIEPTYDALQDGLHKNPHIFHFVGHGTLPGPDYEYAADSRHLRIPGAADASVDEWQGMLAFHDNAAAADLIEADRLAPLLAGCESLELVLLNACEGALTGAHSAFAGLTQKLIQQKISAVIAMQAPIFDDHAARFGREFYEALANGHGIERAVTEGRMSIRGRAPGSWGIPTFYLRASRPFEIRPLSADERVEWLWQKSQHYRQRPERRRALLEGALALDPNHAGARTGLAQIAKLDEAAPIYAAALAYLAEDQWEDAYRALTQVEALTHNFKDTLRLLSEVIGKLDGNVVQTTESETDQHRHYRPVLNALSSGHLIFFLGDGVSRIGVPRSHAWVPGLYPPGAYEAADELTKRLQLEGVNELSLAQAAQYTLLMTDEYELYDRLGEFYDQEFEPTILHKLLAELPGRLVDKGLPNGRNPRYVIVSTTFDDLLERAFIAAGQPYHLFAYRPRFVDGDGVIQHERFVHFPAAYPVQKSGDNDAVDIARPNTYSAQNSDQHPIIIKLCGRRATHERGSVAVTEDQFISTADSEKPTARLPQSLIDGLRQHRVLFIGHSFKPWHVRLLWQRLRLRSGEGRPARWAIVPQDLSEIDKKFWEHLRINRIVARPEGIVAYAHDWLEKL